MEKPGRVAGRFVLGVIAILGLACFKNLATWLAFPYGGREFHAIFAYSAGGRLAVALKLYAVLVGSLTLGARLLVASSYPLKTITIAGLAALVGSLSWWQVVIWPVQSRRFQMMALGLSLVMPTLVCGAVYLTVMPRQVVATVRTVWQYWAG